jgi:hypothetical protein
MIRNLQKIEAFEKEFIKRDKSLSYEKALKIFTSLWKEGMDLGVLPPQDPMEGIEIDIKIAKILNSCLKNS